MPLLQPRTSLRMAGIFALDSTRSVFSSATLSLQKDCASSILALESRVHLGSLSLSGLGASEAAARERDFSDEVGAVEAVEAASPRTLARA